MNVWILMLAVACGIALGYKVNFTPGVTRAVDGVMLGSLYALVACMGVKLGLDETLFSYIALVGLQSLALCVAAIAGSIAVTLLLMRIILTFKRLDIYGDSDEVSVSAESPYKMTAIVVLCLVAGICAARFIPALAPALPYLDTLISLGLCVMVFVAGMGIGKSRDVVKSIRESGLALLIVPTATVIGSVAATVLIAPLLGVKMLEGGAVGGACGWYTLSGMVLTQVDVKLGAMAFLTNMFRETLSFIFVPLIARRLGPFASISACGATSMDSTLAVIVKSTSPTNAITAFSSGLILSLAVPFILNFFIALF